MTSVAENLQNGLQIRGVSIGVEVVRFFGGRSFSNHQYPDYPFINVE
jgi:hypothetical protein